MLYVFILLLIILFIVNKTIKTSNIYIKIILKYILISLCISSFLELTLFNYRHYESLFFPHQSNSFAINYSSNISCNENYCTYHKEENTEEEYYLELTNINNNVKNIYLDFLIKDHDTFDYDISFSDEANKLYLHAGSRTYVENLSNSHYLRLHPSNKVSKIKITFKNPELTFKVNNITLNKHVPLYLNNIRLIISFIISLFILIINPKSLLHDIKYDSKLGKIATISIIISISLLSFGLTFYNTKTYTVRTESSYSQYKNLAHALKKRHFYLDLQPSNKLLSLENPYDTNNRDANLERYQDYYWDYAFYNGKYYSYFGIVPCLLLYYPIYAISGIDMPNNVAMSIAILFFLSTSFYLIYELIKKYFSHISLIWYLTISIFFVFASGLAIFTGYPVFYNLPIIMGASFAMLGLAFYLKSTESSKLNAKYLGLGSLCLALVAGCRPQLILSYLLALPIFWNYIKKRELFSKDSIKETINLILPFIVIAILLMYYNYARFGSPFDFGANYNLTTNDMTKRGFVLDRLFLGLYEFLFAPTRISTSFPFIEKYHLATNYLGLTIEEKVYGGFFFINLICLLSLIPKTFKKIINNHELSTICNLSVIVSLIIIILDTEMAGILPRYMPDFAWLLSLSTIIIILSLLSKKKLNISWQKIILTLILFSISYNALTFFLCNNLFTRHILTYYKIYYAFMFWL